MHDSLNLYRERLHLEQAHFTLIDHEDAIVATVFQVATTDAKRFILKICSGTEYFREVHFLTHFADKLPVPKIYGVVPPERGVQGAILMEYLPGELLAKNNLNQSLVYQIGSLLARLHLERAPGYGDLTNLNHELSSDPRIPFMQKLEEGLEECSAQIAHTLLDKCRKYSQQHLPLLLAVDGPCMIHRDFRPGNVIVDHGNLQGIIDWSSARGGFAEEDFCPLELGEWSDQVQLKNSFLQGYATIRKVPDYQHVMPLLRLSRSVATLGFTIKKGIWKSKSAKLYHFHLQFLESFLSSQK